ncbi:YggT family protein [Candidatus Saccharibacteria bacterium]|nr:YggT family protein [Candidatus Saccharibacteria bacterium]
MAERIIRETTTRDTTADDTVVERDHNQNVLARLIWFIAGVILTLLAFRLIFSLLGANRSNGIADFVYDVSGPLVSPFFGLFDYNAERVGDSSVFEVYTAVAMLVYTAIAWGLAYLATINRRA